MVQFYTFSPDIPKHFTIKYKAWWDGRMDGFYYFQDSDPFAPDPERFGMDDLYTAGFYNIHPNIRHKKI